jgi:magnesium chelatase subunit D
MSIAGDAALVASLFAVDPEGLGGVCLRSLPQPARDQWLQLLRELLPLQQAWRRAPCNISDDRLLGGLDLTATLNAGRVIAARGILSEADGGIVIMSMAERLTGHTCACLSAVIDSGAVLLDRDGVARRFSARVAIVALDESVAEDECVPHGLLDRLAFLVDLSGLDTRSMLVPHHEREQILAARRLIPRIQADAAVITAICGAALALGADSPRVSLLTLRAARAAAALAGRSSITAQDAALAVRLVLAPRATLMPAGMPVGEGSEQTNPEEGPDGEPPNNAIPPSDASDAWSRDALEPADAGAVTNTVLAAAAAAIPKGLLAATVARAEQHKSKARGVGRAGALRAAAGRGRPAGLRSGPPQGAARLNLSATLRTAAPWQVLRGRTSLDGKVRIAASDLRVTRYKQRSRTLTIFAVDASGSAALNRLGEAKGAVELLLAECYIRRDLVSVIAFRGRGAEILLPPTRSLVRAKRSLASLPGGGGTPLAAAIEAAGVLANQARRRGETPTIVLLSDGRANVARNGAPGRESAHNDAMGVAGWVRRCNVAAVFVDTSTRPNVLAQALALNMGAKYVALPYANAQTLNEIVKQSARL